MALDETAWAGIRTAYVETSEPVAGIALRFGITASAITQHARANGWPLRSARRGSPATAGSARKARDQLVHRLYKAIDLKLEQLETRMQSGESLTPADTERDIRALVAMISGFEKVAEVASDAEKERKGTTRKKRTAAPDAERMRREIAERLERLQREREPR